LPDGEKSGDGRASGRPCEFRLAPGVLEFRYNDEGPGFRRRPIEDVISLGNGLATVVCGDGLDGPDRKKG
jgi:hypothetical protein